MAVQARIKPRRARKQQLQERALELRAARMSYRKIGAQLGVSHAWARALCERAFRESAERVVNDATAELGSILAAQDEALAVLHGEMMTADTSVDRSRAASAFARVLHDRARLLGLDAPERVEVAVPTLDDVHRAELAGLSGQALDAELASLGIYVEGGAAALGPPLEKLGGGFARYSVDAS